MRRFILGFLGLLFAVFGATLAFDLVSLREVVSDTGVRRAARLTWQGHELLQHEGAQVVETAIALVGLLLIGGAVLPLLGRLRTPAGRRAFLRGSPTLRRGVLGASLAFALVMASIPFFPNEGESPQAAQGQLPEPSLVSTVSTAIRQLLPTSLSADTERDSDDDDEDDMGPAGPGDQERGADITLVGDALRPGSLRLNATFNSIGIELFFLGDANANATADLEFKSTGEAAWRKGLPLWRTASLQAPGPAFYGSALLLEPATKYELRITLADPDDVIGERVLQGSIVTRAENILPAAALQPTHYVRATGRDGSDGRSEGSAWRTLEHALSEAPAGAIIEVGPGYYAAPKIPLRSSVTLLAQYPAVDDDREVINSGRRTVVEPAGSDGSPAVAAPRNATDPDLLSASINRVAPWIPATPDGDPSHSVWKWAGSPVRGAKQMGYAPSRAELPRRVAGWDDVEGTRTPAEWAATLYGHQTYNYGFYADGLDLYLRLPRDLDPNNFYLKVSAGAGFAVQGPDIRLSGLELHQHFWGVETNYRAVRAIVDHNLVNGGVNGVRLYGENGPPAVYGSDHVIQYNRFVDIGLWTSDHATAPAIPRPFIKQRPKYGRHNESFAIGARGGAHRTVIRYNTIDGYFDAINGYHEGFDRYSMMDTDIYGNLMQHIADDTLDVSRGHINYRVWDNRVEYTLVFLSTGPTYFGPLYVFRNYIWRTTNEGNGRLPDGKPAAPPMVIKYSGRSSPTARVYFVHNTVWTDFSSPSPVNGAEKAATVGANPEAYYLRNNLFRVTRAAAKMPGGGRWDEDYNHFSTSGRTIGLEANSRKYTNDVAAYRAATGQGAHTNVAGDFITPSVVDGSLVDPARGDLSLRPGSPFVDAGVPVPNISDRPGIDYRGQAPDLGASEL